MSNIAYVIYVYLTDFIKIGLILWGIFNMPIIKNKKIFAIVGALQLILLVIGGSFYKDNPDIVILLNVALVIFAVSFLLEGKFIKKVSYSLLSYALALFLDAALVAILTLLNSYSEGKLEHFLFNFINIFTLGFIVVIKKRKHITFRINFSKRIYAMLFTGAGTGVLFIAALLVESNDNITETARRFILIVTIIVVVFYCYICFMFSYISESRDNYKSLSLINQSIIESQQQYYTLVNEKQQEIRSIRHEMKNHLACINSLYHSNKIQEMEEYLGELINLSTHAAELFDTGNDIVNAILNDTQSKYAGENIMIRLEGGFPKEINITPMDISIIFANLISNAVEAILRMERTKDEISCIDIHISSYKDDLYIDIKNPCGNNLKIVNGSLITSKEDKSHHGFGVKNVMQKVEKYNGTYSFKQENNQFMVEIFMENLS